MEQEAQYVADRLKLWLEDPSTPAVYDKKQGMWRRPHPGDCALLYRNSTHAPIYAAALRKHNFSVRLEEGNSFFERLEIKDMRAFCCWLAFPSHTEALVQILKSPLFSIKESDLLEALLNTRDSGGLRSSRHRRLLAQLSPIYPVQIAQLTYLLTQRQRRSPFALLEYCFRERAWLSAYSQSFGDEGPLAVANIRRFLEWVASVEADGIVDPQGLWNKLEESREEELIALASVSDEAVQLMTIHKAKGLEFPLVILAGSGEEWERLDRYWAKLKEAPDGGGLAYIGRKVDRTEHDDHFLDLETQQFDISQQENLRLLYVALTRAQYHLMITGHRRARGKPGFFERMKEAAERMGAELITLFDQQLLRYSDQAAELNLLSAPALPKTREHSELGWSAHQGPLALGPIKILAPARLLQDAEHEESSKGRSFPFARELGVFLHKGLECHVKQLELPALKEWLALRPPQVSLYTFEKLYPEVTAKLAKTLQSQAWKTLMQNAERAWAELPIAYIDQGLLVRGTIDLLLKCSNNEFLVVDYKTIGDSDEPQDLHTLLREKRYDQQLTLYQLGVQRLYPDHKVGTAIFFTEWDKLINLQNI